MLPGKASPNTASKSSGNKHKKNNQIFIKMTLQQLEQYAERNLSSFEDDKFSSFEDEDYTGYGDDFVDFGGGQDFASLTADKIFVLNLKNTATTTDGKIYLLPGIKWYTGSSANGMLLSSGLLNKYTSGTANKLVCSSCVPMSDLDLLYAWIAQNPIQCYAIRLAASNSKQMAEAIVIRHQSPFRTLDEKYLYPHAYINQDSYQTGTVTFDTPGLILSNQTQIELNIAADTADSTISITFFCGANLNTAKALEKKVVRAASSYARPTMGAGTRAAVKAAGGSKFLG